MTFLKGAVQNPVLVGAVMGWFVAQVLKTLIHLMIRRSFANDCRQRKIIRAKNLQVWVVFCCIYLI